MMPMPEVHRTKTSLPAILVEILRCPQVTGAIRCGGELEAIGEDKISCRRCGASTAVIAGIPVFHADAARDYYDGNYKVRSRVADLAQGFYAEYCRQLSQWVRELAIEGPSLDIGCGTAIFADELPGFVGLDYSLEALASQGTADLTTVCGSAESLPFADDSFGAVFSINALEHVPKADSAFEEIDRVLHPGGVAILKPAWHCTRYQTELLPVKGYRELNFRQKITKAMLPILASRPWKITTHVPHRILRRVLASRPTRLRFGKLTPNYSQWIADSDAAASIDCHEAILFFESRGYEMISHRSTARKVLAGHDWVIARKART